MKCRTINNQQFLAQLLEISKINAFESSLIYQRFYE